MVALKDVCVRRLSRGRRSREVCIGRLLSNPRVTVDHRLVQAALDHRAVLPRPEEPGTQDRDSQLQTAQRLEKLVAIAAKAAAIIIQLVQARDGRDHQPAARAFSSNEIDTLVALNKTLEGKTALQKNPHLPNSLARAASIIAKLGGWDGYKSSRPPGPITFYNGLKSFRAIAAG